jgi:hypothetical protein
MSGRTAALMSRGGGAAVAPPQPVDMLMEEENLQLRDRPIPGTAVRHVHLVWTADRDVTLTMFADTLRAAVQLDPLGVCFTFALHTTERREIGSMFKPDWNADDLLHPADQAFSDTASQAVDMVQAKAVAGRPSLSGVLDNYQRLYAGQRVALMACGPEEMVTEASEVAFEKGVEFYTEEFLF